MDSKPEETKAVDGIKGKSFKKNFNLNSIHIEPDMRRKFSEF